MPAIVPVKSLGTRWKQPVVAVCAVLPVAALLPAFSSIVHMPVLRGDHYHCISRLDGRLSQTCLLTSFVMRGLRTRRSCPALQGLMGRAVSLFTDVRFRANSGRHLLNPSEKCTHGFWDKLLGNCVKLPGTPFCSSKRVLISVSSCFFVCNVSLTAEVELTTEV